jgi:Spy/CpxP family protein refolding chaperone
MKLTRLALPVLVLVLGTSALLRAQSQPQDHPQQGYGQDHDRGGWDAPPQEFREIQRQGFHDGIEAARSDFQNQRPPNAERRNEFRNPPVPGHAHDEYREGFRRGYDMAFSHFREDHDRH